MVDDDPPQDFNAGCTDDIDGIIGLRAKNWSITLSFLANISGDP